MGKASAAFKHGIYAEVAVREDVLDEAALIFIRALWLNHIRDGLLVEATARIIVRLRRLDELLERDATSAVLTSMYSRLEGQLTRNLDALGLTPRAAADLGLATLDATARVRKLAEGELARYRPSGARS